MMFNDWRQASQKPVELDLDTRYIYHVQSVSCGIKGLFGGTHGYLTFFSRPRNKWLVVEVTDLETLEIQNATVLYCKKENPGHQEKTVYISDRKHDARWFGHRPAVVDRDLCVPDLYDIIVACDAYIHDDFDLIKKNCNTLVSFLIYHFNLDMYRPIRSIGYVKKLKWKSITEHEINNV